MQAADTLVKSFGLGMAHITSAYISLLEISLLDVYAIGSGTLVHLGSNDGNTMD